MIGFKMSIILYSFFCILLQFSGMINMVIKLKNKKFIILLIILLIVGVIVGAYFIFNNKNQNNSTDYSASKTSTNEEQSYNVSTKIDNNSLDNNNQLSSNIENHSVENIENTTVEEPAKQEIELASFSTKIHNKEPERQNNISITCSKLNDVIIKNGSVFSFCNTIGPATSAKGYQEADIFDKDGNKKKGLGGGNCQVSTTLYNAVLSVQGLVVTERHEHSNKVPYIKSGKDAAVAYGSYDLKFKNNTGFDIKIKATATSNNVTIALNKIF